IIWDAIRASNTAWTSGDPKSVAALYADEVVMVAPNIEAKNFGREAMVEGYVQYCAAARTHSFRELAHDVTVRGDRAVATYRFEVRYELDGRVFDDAGQEVLVFERMGGQWKAVWRTQITTASKEV